MYSPGIHDISFDEYAAIDAVSNTGLGKLAKSPADYQEWIRNKGADEPTQAMRIGKLAHRAVLEPDKFEAEFSSTYAVKPQDMKFSTKEGKDWRNDQSQAGLEIITYDECRFLRGAADAISSHPIASQMLSIGKAEQAVVTEYNGIPVKARIDWLTDWTRGADTIVDMKTTESAEPKDFYWRAIIGRKYYRQAAYYLDLCNLAGIPMKHFTILAIEKVSPYLISCHQISDELIRKGRNEYVNLLGRFAECKLKNEWPGYPAELHVAPLPENYNRVPDPLWLTEAA